MAKVALVTGGNKGIGFEVSRQLARAGYTVLMGSRDPSRGEQAADLLRAEGLDVRAVEVDLLRGHESGVALASGIQEEFGSLGVLVNNAGILDGKDGLASTVGLDILRKTFETNFFGTVSFTQPLLPLLRASVNGRIVNVSSGIGSLTVNGNPNTPFSTAKYLAYNASKAALNMFTVDLAYDLRDSTVKVNSACPGFVATDMAHCPGSRTKRWWRNAALRI